MTLIMNTIVQGGNSAPESWLAAPSYYYYGQTKVFANYKLSECEVLGMMSAREFLKCFLVPKGSNALQKCTGFIQINFNYS